MPAITEQDVLSALKSCYDPEIPVNIVDLGLIYKVDFARSASRKSHRFQARCYRGNDSHCPRLPRARQHQCPG